MGDNLVPNGLSRGCRVFCSRSKYPSVAVENLVTGLAGYADIPATFVVGLPLQAGGRQKKKSSRREAALSSPARKSTCFRLLLHRKRFAAAELGRIVVAGGVVVVDLRPRLRVDPA
jgi:hypothetical protein